MCHATCMPRGACCRKSRTAWTLVGSSLEKPPMCGRPINSHDVGQEEGESLEAGEVGKTTDMVDQSLQLKHEFMVCGRT